MPICIARYVVRLNIIAMLLVKLISIVSPTITLIMGPGTLPGSSGLSEKVNTQAFSPGAISAITSCVIDSLSLSEDCFCE